MLAGGRYDGLVRAMGGPDTPGIGWAAGVERLAMLLDETPAPGRPIAVVPIGDQVELAALRLAEELRAAGLTVEMEFRGKVGQRLKRASQRNARHALLLGEDELGQGHGRPARPRPRRAGGGGARRPHRPPACVEGRLKPHWLMATAIFDTHGFVKRLTAAGMPVEQAEILADESTRS